MKAVFLPQLLTKTRPCSIYSAAGNQGPITQALLLLGFLSKFSYVALL